VKSTTTRTAAALRLRTLSAQGSPFTLPVEAGRRGGALAWREQDLCVPAGMRPAAFGQLHPNHNSIPAAQRPTVVHTVGVTAVNAGYAAKQAAPPRGVPR
jgi:hypothetical protein